MRRLVVITGLLLSAGCSHFAGQDVELSAGTEQGRDQGQPTHKGVYGVLYRMRFDADAEKK